MLLYIIIIVILLIMLTRSSKYIAIIYIHTDIVPTETPDGLPSDNKRMQVEPVGTLDS